MSNEPEAGSKAPEIPQSTALAEATTDSLAEVMSRDPEGYSRQDRARIVEFLRAQRARQAAADSAGPKPRQAAAPKLPLSKVATKTLGDMGL